MSPARRARSLAAVLGAAALVGVALTGVATRGSAPGTLAVLLDASTSVGADERAAAAAWIERGLERLPSSATAARLALGDGAAPVPALDAAAGAGVTDIGRALDQAVRLVIGSGGGRVLLATDGADTHGDGFAAVARARAAGVPIDVLPLGRARAAEAGIESMDAPPTVGPGEVFSVSVLVRSTVDQSARVELARDGTVVASRDGAVRAGALHAFSLPVRAGTRPFDLVAVLRAERDGDAGNNLARVTVGVGSRPRIAAIGPAVSTGTAVERFERVPPEAVLSRYDAVLLGTAPDALPSPAEQARLAAYVRAGGGLVARVSDPEAAARLRGGALEAVLPARLRPPRRDEDETALVLLIDRSGSMDRPEQGRTPVAVALDAAEALASLLERSDRLGIVLFDVAAHPVRPLAPIDAGGSVTPSIPDALAEGGTDWSPALDLALSWLAEDRAPRRHVVLISDGRLAPGASGLPSRRWPEGVTLSTVSIGERADLATMARLAAEHGGRHDRVVRAAELPAVLQREVASLTPAVTLPAPLVLRPAPGFSGVLPVLRLEPRRAATGDPAAMLRVDPREEAEIALRADDDAPGLAFATVGWGRTGLSTFDPAARGADAGAVTALALQRVAGSRRFAADAPVLRGRGAWVDVDVLSDGPGEARVRYPSGREELLALAPLAPGRLRGSFLAAEAGEYRVDVAGRRARFAAATVPERAVLPADPAWPERVAGTTAGRVLSMDGAPTETALLAGRREHIRDLVPGLLALAALIFFGDVALRARRVGKRT